MTGSMLFDVAIGLVAFLLGLTTWLNIYWTRVAAEAALRELRAIARVCPEDLDLREAMLYLRAQHDKNAGKQGPTAELIEVQAARKRRREAA